MTTRAVAEMDDWESSPFSGGYAGLRDLVDDEFSGIVQSGAAKLCLLNGTAVGVPDGSIEGFDGASGTAYEASSPALPLLAMMQDRSDEVRAKYYTEETPISEVDRTLSDGGFSGFVELSENVLSGDYYVVYHAGRSMAVAWVGNSKQLLTGEEAFERADDEVGIYEVRQVDIEPVEIPEPAGASGGAAAGSGGATAGTAAGAPAEAAGESNSDGTGGTDAGDAATDASETSATDDRTEGTDDRTEGTETTEVATADAAGATGDAEPAERAVREDSTAGSERTESRESAPSSGESRAGDASAGAGDVTTPAERLETRSVPSLNPAKTSDPGGDAIGGAATAVDSRSDPGEESAAPDRDPASDTANASGAESGDSRPRTDETATRPAEERPPAGSPGAEQSGDGPDRGSGASERVADLEADIDRLASELASAEGEREDLRRERDELREERDELAAEVEQLETETERLRSQLDELEAEFGGGADGGRRLNPTEALEGTNLFVRYGSKGKATLESAHGGNATREEVSENLDLELHTQFDAADATVGDQPFDEYLRGTLQYRFVTWVVNDLIYEVRETGTVAALQDIYDAIPDIDRAELAGTVTAEFTGDGQQRTSEESFDIVLRDRMGNPLVVANLNNSREAATESMMNSLVSATSRVSESNASLAAAVFVTSSFFEPEALETAADATSGSLLSRDKRESFVKLSRKRGYHLCLAEAREDQFHLAVPEL